MNRRQFIAGLLASAALPALANAAPAAEYVVGFDPACGADVAHWCVFRVDAGKLVELFVDGVATPIEREPFTPPLPVKDGWVMLPSLKEKMRDGEWIDESTFKIELS